MLARDLAKAALVPKVFWAEAPAEEAVVPALRVRENSALRRAYLTLFLLSFSGSMVAAGRGSNPYKAVSTKFSWDLETDRDWANYSICGMEFRASEDLYLRLIIRLAAMSPYGSDCTR